MSTLARTPCDEAIMRAGVADPACANRGSWVLTVAILGSSMVFIDGTVVNVALPAIQSSLTATAANLQWVVESYALFLAALVLVGGGLGDLYGRRKIFLAGTIVFAAASVWCGFAPTIHQLIAARAVQGIGGAMLVPGSLALISASFSEKERGHAIGTWSGFTAITAAIGPVLGGWLVQHASWRFVFFLNIPLAMAVVGITFGKVPESRNEGGPRKLDWSGATLATLGLAGIVYSLIEFARHSVLVQLIGLLGAISLVIFFFIEAHSPAPMMPLQLFRSRAFSGANLLTFFLYAALGAFLYYFPLNLIQVQHYSPTRAGGALLPLILLMFALSRWSGGLVQRYGATLPLILGPLIAATGFALFALFASGGSYSRTIFPAMMILGLGMAVTVAPLTTIVMSSVSQERVGSASGINNAVSRIAGLLAIATLGVLLYHVFDRSLEQKTQSLSPEIRQQIDQQRSRLAAAEISDRRGQEAVNQAFIAGYRAVVWIAAGLAVAGSLSAAVLIGGESHDRY